MLNRFLALVAFLFVLSGTALAGSISGTITYSGSQSVGSFGAIFVAADTLSPVDPNFCNPCNPALLTSPGAYTITGLPDGTYYVATLFAANETADATITDPYGVYGGVGSFQTVTIAGNNDLTGIDITAIDGTVDTPNPFYRPPLTSPSATSVHYDPNMGESYAISFWIDDPTHLASTVTVSGPFITGSVSLAYDVDGWNLWNAINFGAVPPTASLPMTYTFTATKPDSSVVVSTATVTKFLEISSPTLSPTGGANVLTTPTFTWPDLGAGYRYDIQLVDVSAGWNAVWATWDAGDSISGSSLVYPGPPLQPDTDYLWQFKASENATNAEYSKQATFTYQRNTAPISVTGGPYSVNEGSSVSVNGSGSSDPDGTIASYAWDINNDSVFETAGSTASFSATALDGPSVHTIGLKVTDNQGATTTATTTVTVNNVAPTAAIPGSYTTPPGTPIAVTCLATDPGPDILTIAWDLNNDGVFTDANGTPASVTFPSYGSYTVRCRATDDDGGVSTPASVIVTAMYPPDELIADFGNPFGLWANYNNGAWTKLHSLNPSLITTGDLDGGGLAEMIANFPPYGLYARYNNAGAWARLHSLSPEHIVTGDLDNNGQDEVIADFGVYGIYLRNNSGAWSNINTVNPELLAIGDLDGDYNDEVIADYGPSGIYRRSVSGTWSRLHTLSPVLMTTANLNGNGQDELIAAFASFGIWVRNDDATWTKIHTITPELIATGDLDGDGQDDIVADFGAYGIYTRVNNGGWTKLHQLNPELITTGDLNGDGKAEVIADFGAVYGIWAKSFAGSWLKVHALTPELMTTGGLD